jgi:hypothetical protein
MLSVCAAVAVAAVVLVSTGTGGDGDSTRTTVEATPKVDAAAQHRTLTRLAAEDLVRNFRDQGNTNVRGTNVRCRSVVKGEWSCSYVAGGKTCAAKVSGTPADPQTHLSCGSRDE